MVRYRFNQKPLAKALASPRGIRVAAFMQELRDELVSMKDYSRNNFTDPVQTAGQDVPKTGYQVGYHR
jgi:hypothetical protein